ncbi:hypothetical protein E2C01_022087 [Portunus trituberculatus]|uniref:Uncharacterized protein n=1 Tax=Portunus trituberculatus TaxID=210409 RepID=A0A5B7E7Z0_PORTR|nr:hypothetical protein [Portunus trituberculatus]
MEVVVEVVVVVVVVMVVRSGQKPWCGRDDMWRGIGGDGRAREPAGDGPVTHIARTHVPPRHTKITTTMGFSFLLPPEPPPQQRPSPPCLPDTAAQPPCTAAGGIKVYCSYGRQSNDPTSFHL